MPESTHAPGPVLLALSTFRWSAEAAALAIRKAGEMNSALHVLNVVDVNLARYFIGTDIGMYPEIQENAEHELLAMHEEQGRDHVCHIADQAKANGIEVLSYVRVGRFALVTLDYAAKIEPALIVTTRSRRPAWVKRVFGSPVSNLIEKAPCPVLDV